MEKFRDVTHHYLQINHEILFGEITIEEIIVHRWKIMNEPGYNDNYKILVDIRSATFVNFLDDLPKFINYVKKASKLFNLNRKCAFVTSSPEQVAFVEILISHLYEIENHYIINVFSTESAALNWLLK